LEEPESVIAALLEYVYAPETIAPHRSRFSRSSYCHRNEESETDQGTGQVQ
jgi:hypothetical protein